jgi:choline/ethanolamine kinase
LPTSHSGNIRSGSVTEDTAHLAPPSQTPRLVVIDFEYASYNYRAFDFANHFCEWTLDYGFSEPPNFKYYPDKFPSNDEQRAFFRSYLSAGATEPTDAEVNAMIDETRPFVAVSHFFWGVWALLQVELSPVEFGFAV